ncbi:MAG: 2-dehydropantoate 2-reductase [Candidatus Omnitrophica bacterium]|nr:2-dehydropantoate 2-reductase [Candidatus Omnitrophota bacterium]
MAKIVVVGPGAIGSLLAAYLTKGKNEVWLLDKDKSRAKRINDTGIRLEGVSGNWRSKVNASDNVCDIKAADFIIICVKSYDTQKALKGLRSLLGEESLIITLQNGIGNIELINDIFSNNQVAAGSTNMGATLLTPGHIRHAGLGETVLGKLDGKITSQLRTLREIFNTCGLSTRISRDIKGLLWSKLIINVGINALTAITGLNNGRLIEYEWTHKILKDTVTEAIKVTKRKRIKLIFDDPLGKVESVCEATAKNVSSMLQDVLRQKKTEIDFINGVIVRHGQSLGIATPINLMLYELVKTIEASYEHRVSKI